MADDLRFKIMDYLDEHDGDCNADLSAGITELIKHDLEVDRVADAIIAAIEGDATTRKNFLRVVDKTMTRDELRKVASYAGIGSRKFLKRMEDLQAELDRLEGQET